MANSTFEWYPGVELAQSKDLCHWEALPAPLSNTKLLDMRGMYESCGIWAPCLTYCEKKFWLIFTVVHNWNRGPWKDEQNYVTTAPSIEGPWSAPVYLDSSGFDASLYHEDDGKGNARHWLVNMEWDYRKPGAGPKFTGILLQEYSESRTSL
jgi:xylan 1,4-beta-xylosidase